MVTDVGDADSVRAAFDAIEKRFDKLDILINNAAVYRPCAVEHLTDRDIQGQVATNFLGPVYTSRAAIPLMRKAGAGDIVNTSSESTLNPWPMLSMYVSTKAALEVFSRVLADELRDDDIRVTTVVQGTAAGAGMGSPDWAWEPEHAMAAPRAVERTRFDRRGAGPLDGPAGGGDRRRPRLHRDEAEDAEARHGPLPELLTSSRLAPWSTGNTRCYRAR